MKQLLFVLISIYSTFSFSQKLIVVGISPKTAGGDKQINFQVDIPQTTIKYVEKDWLKLLSKGSKGKATIVDGEYVQPAAVNGSISAIPFNVYTKLVETFEGVQMTVWLTQNKVAFISTDPLSPDNQAVQKFIRDFAVLKYQQAVERELVAEKSTLKKLEKDYATLVRREDKAIKKVTGNVRMTKRANEDIAVNNSDIQKSAAEISDQKAMVVTTSSDANATKGASKTLKKMEKKKTGFQKSNEANGKKNDIRNEENRAAERSMVAAKDDQILVSEAIAKQKIVVQNVQTKLDGIR
jgi:hypothetical protein